MDSIPRLVGLVVSVVVLMLLSDFARASTNIIDATHNNGSFEDISSTANFGANDYAVLNSGSTTDLPDWTIGSHSNAYYIKNNDFVIAEDGSRWVEFALQDDTADEYAISQSFAVTAGNTYTVSYWEVLRPGGAQTVATLVSEVSLPGGATGTLSQTAHNTSNTTWEQFTYSFVPNTTTTATLTFTAGSSYGDEQGYGSGLDNVVVTETIPAPEPASLGLLVVGGLLVLRRRR